MSQIKPVYSDLRTLLVSGLSTLGNGLTMTSEEIDNTQDRFDEIHVYILVGGTAAATAFLDARILSSINDGASYDTFLNALHILPNIDMSVDDPNYSARFPAPPKWKIAIKNSTGAALDRGAVYFIGVKYENVN